MRSREDAVSDLVISKVTVYDAPRGSPKVKGNIEGCVGISFYLAFHDIYSKRRGV